MALPSDSRGFLVGVPVAGGGMEHLLSAIKGDTGKILAAMLKAGVTTASRARTVEPSRRSVSSPPRSATTGRFIPREAAAAARAGGGPGARGSGATSGTSRDAGRSEAMAAQRSSEVATAVSQLAATQEATRRQQKADARAQARGKDGRFGAGGRDGGGAGGLAASLAGGVGTAVEGAERIDPLLEAMNEARSVAAAASRVVSPVGRTLGGMLGRSGKGDDGQGGWLRKVWRELRGMRREDAASNKATLRGIRGIKGGSAGGGEDGGGIFGMIGGSVLRVLGSVFGVAAAAISGWFAGGALYKVIQEPLWKVYDYFEGLDIGGSISKAWNETLATVNETFEPARKLFNDLYDWVGKLPGVGRAREVMAEAANSAGAAASSAWAGTKSAAGKGWDAVKGGLGAVGAWFESGGKGSGAVSTGNGDFGGASYGTHQLSSKSGTLQKFLKQSGYGAQFEGMAPGSPEFNAKWKALAQTPEFGQAQKGFIKATHFDPQMAKLQKAGIDLSGSSEAVKEAVWSTSVQFGGNTDLIHRAFSGKNPAAMSDAEKIAAIQDYKAANNSILFRSSDAATRAGTLRRATDEKRALLALNNTPLSAASPAALTAVSTPGMPAIAAIPAAPQEVTMTRLNTPAAAPAPAAPLVLPPQDVADRTIAHIVTGGMGGGALTHR